MQQTGVTGVAESPTNPLAKRGRKKLSWRERFPSSCDDSADCSVRTGVGCVSLISDIPSSSDDLNLAKTGEDYSSGSNAGEVVQWGKQLLSCMWQISTKGRMPSSESVLDIEFLDHFGYTQPLELLKTYLPFF